MRHSGWYPDHVIRLYPSNYYYNGNDVHESLDYGKAEVVTLQGDLEHLTCRDFFFLSRKAVNVRKNLGEGTIPER